MKKIKAATALLFFLSAAACLYGGFSYQMDVVSGFIWRGFDLNPKHKPVVQPQVTYSFANTGFAVNLFLNFSFADKNVNETDLTFTYNFKTGENLALTAGFTNYCWPFVDDFSFKDNMTQEFFVSAGFPKLPLAPTVSVYYDINLGDGLYAEIAAAHSITVAKNTSLDLAASLGYNAGLNLADGEKTGFSDLNLSAAIPFKTGKVTITPYAAYTFVLLDAVSLYDHFWFGVSIAR
jgi:hypothetical protein